jgi:hypothetical protein
LLLAYATIVILLGWWPWHILLLALIAARNPRPSKIVKRAARAPWPPKQITTPSVRSATDLKFDVGRVAVQGAGSPPAPDLFLGRASRLAGSGATFAAQRGEVLGKYCARQHRHFEILIVQRAQSLLKVLRLIASSGPSGRSPPYAFFLAIPL